ncbi:MAG TPA: hypothetical protein VGL41_14555, partial [Roseiarcus sp.]
MKLRPSRAFVAISGLVWALALAGCASPPSGPSVTTGAPPASAPTQFADAGGVDVAYVEFKNS